MNNSLTPTNTTGTFDNDHAFLFGNEFEADIQDPLSEIESSDTIDSLSSNNNSLNQEPDRSIIKRDIKDPDFSVEQETQENKKETALDSDYEDNNPFKGSNHRYAHGIQNSISQTREFTPINDINDHSSSINTPNRQLKSTNPSATLPNSISYIQIPTITKKEVEILGTPSESLGGLDEEEEHRYNERLNRFSYIQDDDLLIKIVYAGKFQFSDGKIAIGYTISYNDKRVTRRYTDFVKLRQTLKKLLPTCIIPPIPDRHSIISYFLQPFQFSLNYNRSNGSKRLIDESNETLLRRSRQFQKFLNICISKDKIKNCSTFLKFIDPDFAHWGKVMSQPPIIILPETNLLAPPLDPVKPSPLHLLLPVPKKLPTLTEEDENLMHWLEDYNRTYIQPCLRVFNNFNSHMDSSVEYVAELGGLYNVSSIETQIFTIQQNLTEEEYDSQDHSIDSSFGSIHEHRRSSIVNKNNTIDDGLSNVLEKVGQIYDSSYVSTQFLINDLNISFKESLEMLLKFNEETLSLINFKNLKKEQNNIIVKNWKQLQERYDFLSNLNSVDATEDNNNEAINENGNETESSINKTADETDIDIVSSTEDQPNNTIDGDISVDSILAKNTKNDYIESILLKNKGNSKAIQAAIKQYTIQRRQSAYKKIMKDLSKNQATAEQKAATENIVKSQSIPREKINEEITELSKKLNNVNILREISDKDISDIDKEFDLELKFEMELYQKVWNKDIIRNIKTSVHTWSNDNLIHWENLLKEISNDENMFV